MSKSYPKPEQQLRATPHRTNGRNQAKAICSLPAKPLIITFEAKSGCPTAANFAPRQGDNTKKSYVTILPLDAPSGPMPARPHLCSFSVGSRHHLPIQRRIKHHPRALHLRGLLPLRLLRARLNHHRLGIPRQLPVSFCEFRLTRCLRYRMHVLGARGGVAVPTEKELGLHC